VLVGGSPGTDLLGIRHDGRRVREPHIGRTRTAPRRTRCAGQLRIRELPDICEGSQHAYRRMIAEDERAPSGDDLDFVLHLGDFVTRS
jgi:alkaline phosphatase D